MASHRVEWQQEYPRACRGGAVAIGKFDGVHLGHAALVRQVAALARPAVLVTFDPHPLALLRPEQQVQLLTDPEDRSDLLHRLGADHVLTLRTTPDLLGLRAGEFFDEALRRRLGARAVVEGPDFRFGRGREGDLNLLRQLCAGAGIEVAVAEPVRLDGVAVSSGRVREALTRGDVAEAARLLGRPYLLRGVVGSGERRGRRLGFPTANLEGVQTVVPATGVYAARAVGVDGQDFAAALNIGPNPTFGEQAFKIEAHLVGYAGDLYGRPLALELVERLRDVRAFPGGVPELTEQLHRDVQRTVEVLG